MVSPSPRSLHCVVIEWKYRVFFFKDYVPDALQRYLAELFAPIFQPLLILGQYLLVLF